MNYISFLTKGGALLVGTALLVLGGQFLLPALLPFLGGGLMAVLLRRPACWIKKVTHMRYSAAAIAACLLFYGLFCLLIFNLGFLIFAQTVAFFTSLPEIFAESLIPTASLWWESSAAFMSRFLPSAGAYMEALSDWISAVTAEALSQLSAGVLRQASALLTGLPAMVLGIFLGILSSFFILIDYDKISAFVYRQLSPRLQRLVRSSKDFLVSTGKNVIKAYFLLMLITFGEVSAGLWLLGIPYFAVLGIIVAAVDILPIVGSGAVLVPCGIYLLISGQPSRGMGILLLYGVVSVVRTIAEPKILGDRIGLPPLVTILSMYLGLRFFGIAGMILTPMFMTLLVHLHKKGLLKPRRDCGT